MKTQKEKASEQRMVAFRNALFELTNRHMQKGLTLEEVGKVMAHDIATTFDALIQAKLNPENKLADGPEANNS